MNPKELARHIHQLREDHYLFQKEVAAVLGISQPAYSDKENGHVAFTAVELDKLAELYDSTLDDLMHADQQTYVHGRSSLGLHPRHTENRSGEERMKGFRDALAANTRALEQLSEQQTRMIELLHKR